MKHDTNFTPSAQGIYVPTQSEIRAAIARELAQDICSDATPALPSRVFSLIDRALDRANAGEFQ